ncbi:MAG: dipeptidase [Trueperaceae bacterium]|nr:dipeptidase [Trueperaceae bacterium]
MANWQSYLEDNQEQFQAEMLEFLRIPSISSLKAHFQDVAKAADWVAARMKKAGIEQVSVMETGGHPVVYGQWLNAENKPTILIYGHFDTQPVDPLELWDNPPFEPVIKDGKVVARGASDDKGNMLVPILAVEALLAAEGSLPVNVKFIFEGQEEIGSPQLPAFIESYKDLLACDLVLSADGGQWGADQPALWVGLRGLCALEINVMGANSDLHSGSYGGVVQNPLHALVQLLASMRDSQGNILVKGFYDDVRDLSEQDRERIAAVPFNEAEYKEALGIDALFGEEGYTPYERGWARPTLEINGMWGGFQGEGIKTVLPNEAHAKISCRLVADQDPKDILECLKAHIKEHSPAGVSISLEVEESTANPYLMPAEHPGNKVAGKILEQLYGKEPLYVRAGGSIPFCSLILEQLGVYTVVFGFGLKDEKAHAPNEFFRLSSFEKGQKAYCLLLHKLAETSAEALRTL